MILRLFAAVLLLTAWGVVACPAAAAAQPGESPAPPQRQWWAGSLTLPGPRGPVPVGFVVCLAAAEGEAGEDGSWAASFDLVPGPGTLGISAVECRDVVYTPTELAFTVPPPVATVFRLRRAAPGAPSAHGEAVIESLGAMAASASLVTEMDAMSRIIPRPQTPRPPYAYGREEVSMLSLADGLTLAGELTIPRTPPPHPAVILISDGGAQDRDHNEEHHRPFLVLADHLTRRGFAVLRMDDRGVGGSQGVFTDATLDTITKDVRSATAMLAARDDIDSRRIGLLGLGDGAIVAALAAAAGDEPGPRAVVLLSPPGVTGKQNLILREQRRMEAEGEDPAYIEAQASRLGAMLDLVTKGTSQETIAEAIRDLVLESAEANRGTAPPPEDWQLREAAAQQAFAYTSPAALRWLTLDPAEALRGLRTPVLVLSGELDLTVPAADNFPRVVAALKESGASVTAEQLPGLNHYLQPATTGFADEVVSIQTTIHPGAMERIGAWLEAELATGE